jgi:hypothetical protein
VEAGAGSSLCVTVTAFSAFRWRYRRWRSVAAFRDARRDAFRDAGWRSGVTLSGMVVTVSDINGLKIYVRRIKEVGRYNHRPTRPLSM